MRSAMSRLFISLSFAACGAPEHEPAPSESSVPDVNVERAPFQQVAVGHRHSCGLRSSGEVNCWGDNAWGQRAVPDVSFSEIATSIYRTCGLTTGGRAVCWGTALC